MNVGILAAGAGSRLRAGGFHMPKPLLPIAGVPLIGRLLGALQPLMPEAIVCIINNQGTSVADYVRQHHPTMPMQFVQQDTASSYESKVLRCCARICAAPLSWSPRSTRFFPLISCRSLSRRPANSLALT